MMVSNYFIITFIFSIAIHLYGIYLLDRFKLEERFPKVATILKYRKKESQLHFV
jgi:hypothetical protein